MLTNKQLLELLEKMWIIRKFEEKAAELFTRGLIRGSLHTSVGQEAVAVATAMALKDGDYIQTTHRGHAHVIAKGADIKIMMAELLGKATGYNKGKGGSMHVSNLDMGILGANGIVGGGNPVATGAAFSAQYRGTDNVVLSYFGDGASNQGTFHESVNLSACWNLPVIFVVENNLYAISTPFCDICANPNISDRAVGYGIPGVIVDGMSVWDVYEKTTEAIKRARAGEGPTLLECKVYRFVPHSKADREVYRTKDEVEQWKEKCPINAVKNKMVEEKFIDEDEAKAIEEKAKQLVQEAVEFGMNSPDPDESELFNDVYYKEASV